MLLEAWESGLGADPVDRAVPLLETLYSAKDLGDLAPGAWNRLALRARALLFGADCDTVAECPACGAQLEAAIPVEALLAGEPVPPAVDEISFGAVSVRYRPPTRGDIAALAAYPVDEATARLLRRCVTEIRSPEREMALDELSEEQLSALDEAIALADPDAVIEVALACPECGETARLPLDPASFLWDEIDRWALGVLCEVAELATAFGWSQDAILAMSPWRRQAYLALAAGGRSS